MHERFHALSGLHMVPAVVSAILVDEIIIVLQSRYWYYQSSVWYYLRCDVNHIFRFIGPGRYGLMAAREAVVGRRPRMSVALRHPRTILLAGAMCMGLAAVFVKLADVSPSTATAFRCGLVLPVLAPWVIRESHRRRPSRRAIALYLVGGVFLGTDLALWSQGILEAGAGISTVALNVQVIVVPLLGWMFLRERIPGAYAITVPVVLIGLAMVSGIFGGSYSVLDTTTRTLAGGTVLSVLAGVAYGAYLFLLGRHQEPGQRVTQLFYSAVGAAVAGAVVGSFWGSPDPSPGWPALGWLTALAAVGQILGWLLISIALPRLSSGTGASILLVQPIAAIALGAAIFGERLSMVQLLGGIVVVAAVWYVNARKHG